MAVTVPAPISRHLLIYVAGALAAVALVVSVLVGMAIADSSSSPATGSTPTDVQESTSTRFSEGSPDAIEHRAANDPARYGSPDAAEEWNR
jgi:hypothetical protein